MKKTSPLIVAAIVLLNATIFFSDFLPYNTWLKAVAVVGMVVHLMSQARANLIIDRSFQGYILFNIWVLINLAVGGDIDFIIVFTLNTIILLLMASTPGIAALQYKIVFMFSGVHVLASLFAWIAPVSVTNTLFQLILGNGYSTNYNWRVQQQANAGITSQPGLNAMYLLCFLFVCLTAYMTVKKHRKIYLVGCVISFLLIVTTGKRSALLLSIAAVLCALVILRDKKISANKLLKTCGMVVLIVAVVIFAFSRTTIFDTIRNKMELLLLADNLSNGRIDLWNIAWKSFLEHPVLGIGLKSIHAQTGVDVHNTYIQILTETGIVGFLLFVLALVRLIVSATKKTLWLWKNADKSKCKPAVYGIVMIISLLLYGFVGNTFIDYMPLSTFVCACAMVNECYRLQRLA